MKKLPLEPYLRYQLLHSLYVKPKQFNQGLAFWNAYKEEVLNLTHFNDSIYNGYMEFFAGDFFKL